MIVFLRTSTFFSLILLVSVSGFNLPANAQPVEPQAWVNEQQPIVTDPAIRYGGLLTEDYLYVEQQYGTRRINLREADLDGFKLARDGQSEDLFAHAVVADRPASLEYAFDKKYSGRPTVVVIEDHRKGWTGKEALTVYHNDHKLAVIPLGDRAAKRYAYPYDWSSADERGDVPMELSFQDKFRLFATAYVLPRRTFLPGEKLRISAKTPGAYSIEELLFVPRAETLDLIEPAVRYPEAKAWASGHHASKLQLAWVTALPSRCTVIWGSDRSAVDAGNAQTIPPNESYAENHQRFIDSSLKPGESIYWRVLAEANDGRRIATPVFSYTEPDPLEQTADGTVSLRFLDSPPSIASPARVSVPFAPGRLASARFAEVLDGISRQPVSAQFEVTSRHADGSVRFLVAHFLAQPDTPYLLHYGPEVTASSGNVQGLKTERNEDRWVVGDASTRVVFDATAPAGVAGVWHDPADQSRFDESTRVLAETPLSLVMTEPKGERFVARPEHALVIEREGPEMVRVRVEGHFVHEAEALFHFVARWTVRRGYPGVTLSLTVGNDRPEQAKLMYEADKTLTRFESIDLLLNLTAPASTPRMGVGRERGTPSSMRAIRHAFQRDERTVVADGEVLQDTLLAGTLDVTDDAGHRVGLTVNDFWQQYPAGFGVEDKTIRVGLFADFEPDDYPAELDAEGLRLRYHFKDGQYQLMTGVQKTHRLAIAFGPQVEQHLAADRVLPAEHLMMPSPKAASGTGVFGPLRPTDEAYASITRWNREHLDVILEGRDRQREYGVLNFGDWFGERGVNWGNHEYDLGQAASQELLRTGERDWFEVGLQAAMHQADVDTQHYGRNAGLQVMHAGGHTGREYFNAGWGLTYNDLREITGGRVPFNQTFHAGHMWIGGIAQYAAMLGNPRLLDAAHEFGQTRAAMISARLSPGHHRGWGLFAATNLIALDHDPFYRNWGRILFDRYRSTTDEPSGTPYVNPNYEHETISAIHRAALIRYGQVTGDPAAEAVFRRTLPALRAMWAPDVEGFIVDHHGWWSSRHDQPLFAVPLAEAYRLTGDDEWRDMLLAHMRDGLTRVDRRSKVAATNLLFASWWPAALASSGIDTIEPHPVDDDVRAARDKSHREGVK